MADTAHRVPKVQDVQALPVARTLKSFVHEGHLYRRLDATTKVQCTACGHRCVIYDGFPGICRA